MRVVRAYAPSLAPELELEGDEANHLARVLRLRPGDAVEVFDGEGRALLYQVADVSRRRVVLTETGPAREDRALPYPLRLAVAPPKGKRAQRLVEALTELGVSELRFLQLERTQAKLPDPELVRRWALEAAKQCGRNRLPITGPSLSTPELLAEVRATHTLFGHPEQAQPVALAAKPLASLVVVGPEGGLTTLEQEQLRDAGAIAVCLGPTVLRIETAAVALAAATVASWEGSA